MDFLARARPQTALSQDSEDMAPLDTSTVWQFGEYRDLLAQARARTLMRSVSSVSSALACQASARKLCQLCKLRPRKFGNGSNSTRFRVTTKQLHIVSMAQLFPKEAFDEVSR